MNSNPLNFWRKLTSSLLVLAAVALPFTSFGATLVQLPLNEGSGTNVTDTASGWDGYLYIAHAANADTDEPLLQDASPSPAAGDRSVLIRGNGYLVARDTNSALAFATNQGFTLEGWVQLDLTANPDFLKNEEGIISYGNAYSLRLNSGRLAFRVGDDVLEPPPTQPIIVFPDGWHHVAAAFNPGVGVTLYLDGVGTFVAYTNRVPYYYNNLLFLGAERGTNNILANLDRLRVHRAVLTGTQLDTIASTPRQVYPVTVAAYNFDGTLPAANSAAAVMPAISSLEFLENPPWMEDDPNSAAGDFSVAFDALWQIAMPEPDPENPILSSEVTNFTVEAYVKLPDSLPPDRMVILESSGTPGFTVGIEPDGTLQTVALGKREMGSTAQVPTDGQWHHIALVHEDGVEIRFYVDGVLEDTVVYTQGPGVGSVPQLTIGRDLEGLYPFVGSVDRVRISDAVLTVEEFDFQGGGNGGDGPALEISEAGGNVTVSWAADAGDFVLETSPVVGPNAEWTVVTHQTSGGQNTYTTEATADTQFFRLRGN